MSSLEQLSVSDEDNSDESRRKKNNSAPAARWTRPPIPLLNRFDRQPVERRPDIRPSAELLGIAKNPEDEDDEGDEKPSAADMVAAKDSAVEQTAQTSDAAEAASDISDLPEELFLHADEQQPAQEPEQWEPLPGIEPAAEQAEEPSEEPAEPPRSHFDNIVPPVPPSGESRPTGGPDDDQPPVSRRYAAAPPTSPGPNMNAMFDQYVPNYDTAPTAPTVSVEQHRSEVEDAEYYAEKRGLRRGLVAGFITGYALKAYLSNRKRERYEKETKKQMDKRDESINWLERQQDELQRRVSSQAEELQRHQRAGEVQGNQPRRFEQPVKAEALPPVKAAEAGEHVFDQEGNEIVLQPGWHVERSAGGYSVVLDEHNRVVHDAINYGEAFHRDKKREQISDDVFGTDSSATATTDDDTSASQPLMPLPPQSGQPTQPSQTYGPQPGSPAEVDIKHRLPKPQSPLVSAITSPWLWTAIALLLIVYFLAALA